VLSIAPGEPGFKDGSNPGLGAAITAVSPSVSGGGVPCPAHVAALDAISVSFFFAMSLALIVFSIASYSAPFSLWCVSFLTGSAALAAAACLAVGGAGSSGRPPLAGAGAFF